MFISPFLSRIINVRINRCTDSEPKSTEEGNSGKRQTARKICRTCRQSFSGCFPRRSRTSIAGTCKSLERTKEIFRCSRQERKEAKERLVSSFFPFFSFFNNYTTYLMMIDFSLIGYDIQTVNII